MLSARELDVERLAENARTWTNERLVYTHGYGITAVPRRRGDRPRARPTTSSAASTGSRSCRSVSRGSTSARRPTPTSSPARPPTSSTIRSRPAANGRRTGATTTWNGSTGVGIGNLLTRALFALRFGDFNLLISDQLTDDSQILFRRDDRGASARDRAVPGLRPRPVSRQRGRPAALGLGRLHRDRSLPERPAAASDEPIRGRELHAQQRQGRGRRLRRQRPVLPGRSGRADRRGLRAHLPRAVRADDGDARRADRAPALPRGPVHRPERDATGSTTCRPPTAARRPTTTRTTAGRSPRTSSSGRDSRWSRTT